jgi:hypothetical protein
MMKQADAQDLEKSAIKSSKSKQYSPDSRPVSSSTGSTPVANEHTVKSLSSIIANRPAISKMKLNDRNSKSLSDIPLQDLFHESSDDSDGDEPLCKRAKHSSPPTKKARQSSPVISENKLGSQKDAVTEENSAAPGSPNISIASTNLNTGTNVLFSIV